MIFNYFFGGGLVHVPPGSAQIPMSYFDNSLPISYENGQNVVFIPPYSSMVFDFRFRFFGLNAGFHKSPTNQIRDDLLILHRYFRQCNNYPNLFKSIPKTQDR